ncbi:MAG: hypothetical protein WBM75_18165, partial [Polyangiales bacterium]
VVQFDAELTDLPDDGVFSASWEWTAPDDKVATVYWTATVTAPEGDTNPANDTASSITKVRKN